MLGRMECLVGKALVLDVTNEGWEDEAAFSIENDHGFDIITGYHIVELLQASGLRACLYMKQNPMRLGNTVKAPAQICRESRA